jgi:hypothetical protein
MPNRTPFQLKRGNLITVLILVAKKSPILVEVNWTILKSVKKRQICTQCGRLKKMSPKTTKTQNKRAV